MNTRTATAALSALAHQSRLAVFRALVQAGPPGLAAGAIARRTRVAPSALSFHLKELSRAGLADARQDGRFIYYAANFNTMNALLAFLTENCCGGEECGVECAPPTRKRTS
jgi:ArsR family transcriptional regulator, arsenate/arsenite/antimonite-responsive transcriptional repressor